MIQWSYCNCYYLTDNQIPSSSWSYPLPVKDMRETSINIHIADCYNFNLLVHNINIICLSTLMHLLQKPWILNCLGYLQLCLEVPCKNIITVYGKIIIIEIWTNHRWTGSIAKNEWRIKSKENYFTKNCNEIKYCIK